MPMENVTLIELLVGQLPIVAILGWFLRYFVIRYEESEKEKSQLAQDVVKLTLLFEVHGKDATENSREFRELLKEINRKLDDFHK